jgi:hypothetical protein
VSPQRGRRGCRRAGLLLAAGLAVAACAGTGASRTGDHDACDVIAPAALSTVAELRDVTFLDGERYPHAGTCMWWSDGLPVYSVTLTMNSPAPAESCGDTPRARAGDTRTVAVSVCRYDGEAASYLPAASAHVRTVVLRSTR